MFQDRLVKHTCEINGVTMKVYCSRKNRCQIK